MPRLTILLLGSYQVRLGGAASRLSLDSNKARALVDLHLAVNAVTPSFPWQSRAGFAVARLVGRCGAH